MVFRRARVVVTAYLIYFYIHQLAKRPRSRFRKTLRSVFCMKMFLTMILASAACAKSADIKFAWDYPFTPPDGFEMRLTHNNEVIVQDCLLPDNNECVVPNLSPGSYEAACFAYRKGVPDLIKEYSDSSNVVLLSVPEKPAAPINNSVKGGTSSVVIKLSFDEKGNLYAQQTE